MPGFRVTFDTPDTIARLVVHRLSGGCTTIQFEGKLATWDVLCVISHKEEAIMWPVGLLQEVITALLSERKKMRFSGNTSAFKLGVLRAEATPKL